MRKAVRTPGVSAAPARTFSPQASVLARHNVRQLGPDDGPVLVLVQGFGCDQVIWDRILPRFTDTYRVVLLDHAGTGGADPAAYDPERYASLNAYVADLVEVLDVLEAEDATVVGHSVAGMMALAAAVDNPRIGRLVLLCASPCYLNSDGYAGGFDAGNLNAILNSVEANYPLWASAAAPGIAGAEPGSPASMELQERLCRLHPDYVRDFLRMSFAADVRHLLPRVGVPSLILQAAADPLTPGPAAGYLHGHLGRSTLVRLHARGNMPHLSDPGSTAAAIRSYLEAGAHA